MIRKRRKIINTFIIRWYVKRMLSIFILYAFLFCTFIIYCSARDTVTTLDKNLISDSKGETLVSTGNKFELGFFTPNGSSDQRRYVGIWYYRSNPQTIVWVANRDNPVMDNGGVFAISGDGNLKVFDGNGRTYWSTNLDRLSSTNRMTKLMDCGNLLISDEDQENHLGRTVWQSFDNPTDTFLPGMKMDEKIILTSWTSYDDPAPGNFTFQLDQEGDNQFILWKRSMRYWKSGVSGKFIGSDEMPSALSYLLSNFTSTIQNDTVPHLTSALYSDTRMIMSFTGQIQYFKWKNEKVWSLIWAQPRDRCSVYNACGNFGICNSNNKVLCKCLPGFGPNLAENWNSGDFSGGCSRKSTICGKNAERHTFLSLHMMNVGNPDSQFNAKNEMECKLECLNNCQCQAYSYEEAKITQRGVTDDSACWIWSVDLNNLQEEYEGGGNLYVRAAGVDAELTTRTCEICGANLIPYPLSTGPKCGDAMYLNFHCNISTGQVGFQAPGGTYKITRINPETRKFAIQTKDGENCEGGNSIGKFLHLDWSSPFQVTGWCNTDPLTGTNEVEISWEPPPEPTCSSSADCKGWPNSSCNKTRDGKKRCLCDRNFQWESSSLSCSKGGDRKHGYGLSGGKMPLSIIIAITFISIIILVSLASTIFYIYTQRRRRKAKGQGNRGDIQRNLALHLCDSERHVKDLIDSGRFKEDDAEGIDVPFFDFESILTATDYFSNINRLGQGGFGPVYKAKFPGGQEIAVKRLSSCSGQGSEEFKNEVVLIAKLQHRNLVRLLGYCVSGDEKILLYEYMPNKSLDSSIFDQKLSMLLDWELRYNIILGIARGLLYLHQDSRLRIIHRDLKTSNILLDEEMNPKISDFGLARIFGGKETAVNTKRVVGTYGYMSPEYALDGLFSFKSDVFSFGVVVLEIISGKRSTGFYQPKQNLSLLGYAWQLWKEDKAMNLLEQTIRDKCDINEVVKCLTVGLLCVQEDPSDRPTMSNVVFMLGSETATLPTPKQPAFVVRRCASSRASSSSKPETLSHNGLTITLEDGR